MSAVLFLIFLGGILWYFLAFVGTFGADELARRQVS